ncbi:MAG: [NiFe] hydrogenase metallocenter assembly protein HypF [Myxococcales bacterium]|nr:[NiFe] hydrogenase metallocenter assembly protein HypF [Myxococcales bacterium]
MVPIDNPCVRPNRKDVPTSATQPTPGACVRVGLRVRGVVQGVGFRPTVHRFATGLGLGGSVRNDSEGVWIELQGQPEAIARFMTRLACEPPARARIDAIERRELVVDPDGARVSEPAGEFRIVVSTADGAARARLPVDGAPCAACLEELDDPRDRRHRYPFINCTDCGPRYTIARDVPYDRARTTMAPFLMCEACQAEYDDPRSRRFHAEPNGCPRCGPRLLFVDGEARYLRDEALAAAVRRIVAGGIVAVKGVGGFLLAADARNETAIERLRARKRRPHKPLALMARDLATIESIAHVAPAARAALLDPARPIVLLPRRHDAELPASLAPGLDELGVMLPSTPLHHLLLSAGPPLQVMTSGNRGDEPIARDDAEASALLDGIADAMLTHDREIHTRADDSVVRIVAGAVQPVRRARGFVPEAIALPCDGPPLVAVGGQLKVTVCLARAGEAFVSQHLGDLSHPATDRFFVETIDKLGRLLRVEPQLVAHDLHPDYRSTRWALASGLPRVAVQHHHAHVAACLAEHGRSARAIGVAFDGTGCGLDGSAWGGEWLVADLRAFTRAGHLRPIRLLGGEAAIKEPWRLALSALDDAGVDLELLRRIDERRRQAVQRLCASSIAAPSATGAGRWFDAVASLAGLRDEVSYEGQAAIELEAAADDGEHEAYPFTLEPSAPFVIDLRPTIRAVAAGVQARVAVAGIAARFHETMARAIAAGCRATRAATGLETVALSGGCFHNRRLTERAVALLAVDGFETLVHRRVPPGDGGLSLGQAAIASCRRTERRS